MNAPAKVMRSEARVVDGRLCYVLIGQDVAGNPVEMAIPEEGLQPVFAEAAQRLNAFRSREIRETRGDYTRTFTQPGTPAQVGSLATTEGETVVLIARQGTPQEIALRFSPADARTIAERLADTANQADAENARRPKAN